MNTKTDKVKTLSKNIIAKNKQAKINSKIEIDPKLDEIKNIKFTSNKLEELNKLEFKLTFK